MQDGAPNPVHVHHSSLRDVTIRLELMLLRWTSAPDATWGDLQVRHVTQDSLERAANCP